MGLRTCRSRTGALWCMFVGLSAGALPAATVSRMQQWTVLAEEIRREAMSLTMTLLPLALRTMMRAARTVMLAAAVKATAAAAMGTARKTRMATQGPHRVRKL